MKRKKSGKHKKPKPQYPAATIAFYGPDKEFASKVAVGIIPYEGAEAGDMEKWSSKLIDVRNEPSIGYEIKKFLESHNVKTVVYSDGIIGCPHEEGIDYPLGEYCPKCPFWIGRDRWTGNMLQ